MNASKPSRKWSDWLIPIFVFAFLGMCVWSVIWLYTPKHGVVRSFRNTPDTTFADLKHEGPIGFHWQKPYSGFSQNAICRTDEESIRAWVQKHEGTISVVEAIYEGESLEISIRLPEEVLDEFGHIPATRSVGDLEFNVDIGDYDGAGGYFDHETGQAFLTSWMD